MRSEPARTGTSNAGLFASCSNNQRPRDGEHLAKERFEDEVREEAEGDPGSCENI
jgi:hypothetical protein